MKRTLSLVFFFVILSSSYSADYNLNDCLRIAWEKSIKGNIVRHSHNSRMLSHDGIMSQYYPQVYLTGSAPGLTRGLALVQDTGVQASQVYKYQSNFYYTANIAVSQKIPYTGGELTVVSGLEHTEYPDFPRLSEWKAAPVQINLTQPLLGFNSQKWELESEKIKAEGLENQYIEEIEDLNMETTEKFFNLYFAEMNVKNAELNVISNDSLFRLSRGRYNVGKIAENDLLQSELAYTNSLNALESYKLTYMQAMEQFKIFLGLPANEEITAIPPSALPDFKVNPERALQNAIENSSAFINIRLNKLEADRSVAYAESENGFSATLTASYGLNNSAKKIPDVYKNSVYSEGLNIGFSVPIYRFGAGSSRIGAALETRESVTRQADLQKQNLELTLKYEILRFEQLRNQVNVAARADTIASRRFEVAKNRYKIGTIDVNNLFVAQNEKDSAFLNYMQTLKDFWTSYFNIRKLTLFDFEKGEKIKY